MDISLCCEERGSGFPLVLLHGNGEDHSYFVHQLDAFAGTYHMLAPDTRGHGATPRGTAPMTIRRFADDLLEFLSEHQLEQVHLLGFSDGGNTALCFALSHPERVRSLVLNGANLHPSGVRRRTQWPIEWGYRVAGRFAGKSAEAARHAELLGLMVNDPMIPPESLTSLQVPTLVIAGTHDMILRRHTEQIARLLPDAELAILPGNHFLANRRPEAFNRRVAAFLQKHTPSTEMDPKSGTCPPNPDACS